MVGASGAASGTSYGIGPPRPSEQPDASSGSNAAGKSKIRIFVMAAMDVPPPEPFPKLQAAS
jgi:hypothetical protein